MPPKKEEKPTPVLMGRVGTNLKCGILGVPNVGKSTFFNILTKSAAPAENFPFCTIDPNEARCPVPDPRFDFLCEHYQPLSRVPAYLNVVDIAGLVRGANEGKGLGNAFLSHVRAVDAMFEMVRIFESEEVTHVEGEVDPVRDLETIADELRLKDLEYVRKEFEHTEKLASRAGDKQKKFEAEVLQRVLKMLEEEKKPIRLANWNEREVDFLNEHLLLTSKPIVYLLNMSEDDYIRKKNKWLGKVKTWVDANDPHATIIPLSCELELRLSEMQSDDERKKYLEEKGVHSAMEKIVTTGYRALQLQYFFTSGKDEVRAWTVSVGTKAPQAAGRVHTDMEKGFIMAEVMAFEDFKTEGNETACRSAGKYKQKGRDYVVEDGDIIFFKFNPPQQAKKK